MNRQSYKLMLAGLLLALRSMAATHYVVPPGTPGVATAPDYTSWATAATNIAHAVAVATNNSVVLVSNGTYRLAATIELTKSITLRSFNNGVTDRAGTIIDGGFPAVSNRCIYVNNTAALIDGFTITNGYAPATSSSGNGGGVYLYQKGTVTNCVIAGNRATGSGGGMYLQSGGLVVASTLSGNIATNLNKYGGGAYLYAAGTLTNCIIIGNRSRWGAGAYLWGPAITVGSAALRDCDIIANVATVYASGEGGAGTHGTYKSLVSDCRIVSNTIIQFAGSGYAAGTTLGKGGRLYNNYVAYNKGANYGGGIQIGDQVIASNCVIRNNSAGNGGGVYLTGGGLLTDSVVASNSSAMFVQNGIARNCLIAFNGSGIWANTGGGYYQNCTIVSNGSNLLIGQGANAITGIVENCILYYNGGSGINYSTTAAAGIILTNSCTLPLPSGRYDSGNTTSAPRMVNYRGFDFRLRGSSPCVDKGVYRAWMARARDRSGDLRIRGAAVDIGVFEYKPGGSAILVR